VLTFPVGNGLQVSTANVIPLTQYTIVVLFRLQTTGGYRRIIDLNTAARNSDTGLYDHGGGLDYYNFAAGSDAPITPSSGGDPYHEVYLSRSSSGLVIGYVDGVEQLRFTDTTGAAVINPGQTVTFFKDDNVIPGEESAGAVANIRLYDGPLKPPPPPVLGKAVDVTPVSGQVLVKKGNAFVPLKEGRQIPVGSVLNTLAGTVRLASSSGTGKTTYSGEFQGAIFKVLQSRSRRERGLTELRLDNSTLRRKSCPIGKSGDLRSAAAARLSSRTIQRLHARGRGRFSTRGQYSAATVRGTDYEVTDRCDGTLTRVTRGSVVVTDFRAKRTITLTAGKSYFARAP
jgi:hypothetical protein